MVSLFVLDYFKSIETFRTELNLGLTVWKDVFGACAKKEGGLVKEEYLVIILG